MNYELREFSSDHRVMQGCARLWGQARLDPLRATYNQNHACPFASAMMLHQVVNNRFSVPNKVQIGQDQYRKDIMNNCQEKALKKGCCEREWAQTDVSSTEKTNTKKNLARAMTKSKSKMQTVTNGCVSQKRQ